MGSPPLSRSLAFALVVGAGLSSLRLAACGGEDRPGNGPGPRPNAAETPGIVLLCIDTLRADARASMPRLDAFAKGATVFDDAAASASWTAPSIATLLTGLLPAHTGVRGAFAAEPLVASVTTLAEALRERGYVSAAFTAGGWVDPGKGFGQGFGAFSTAFDKTGPAALLADWEAHRPKGAPFFLFLHTYAAHDPYGEKHGTEVPPDVPEVMERARIVWREAAAAGWRLSPEAAAWVLDLYLFDEVGRVSIGRAVGTSASARLWDMCMEWLDGSDLGPDRAALAAKAQEAYRRGLAYADRVVGTTLSTLESLRLPADTVIAIVGDHGEGLGEHGTLSHGRRLYDELVRVPLYVSAPGRLEAGTTIRGSCGLVDVMPTLLELAGARPPPGLDGRSLVPLARGREKGHPVFAEEERRVHGDAVARSVRLLSVRTEAAKLVLTFDLRTLALERSELYDLVADPAEATPLAEAEEARFGEAFCRAAARLRASIPGIEPRPCK